MRQEGRGRVEKEREVDAWTQMAEGEAEGKGLPCGVRMAEKERWGRLGGLRGKKTGPICGLTAQKRMKPFFLKINANNFK